MAPRVRKGRRGCRAMTVRWDRLVLPGLEAQLGRRVHKEFRGLRVRKDLKGCQGRRVRRGRREGHPDRRGRWVPKVRRGWTVPKGRRAIRDRRDLLVR